MHASVQGREHGGQLVQRADDRVGPDLEPVTLAQAVAVDPHGGPPGPLGAGDVVHQMVADEDALAGIEPELAFDDLEDALVGLGDPVVLREDDALEDAAQPDRLGQPAPVGEQPQPVVLPQRRQSRDRVIEERRVSVAMSEVRVAQLERQRLVARDVAVAAAPLRRP